MTQEWINNKIKEAYENAVEKGFYECKECNGKGEYDLVYTPGELESYTCDKCDGEGIYRDIGELLMLIITELSEAVEAHRKNKTCKRLFEESPGYKENFQAGDLIDEFISDFKNNELKYSDTKKSPIICMFEDHIKNTLEDEMADVFIRLFDLAGYTEIKYVDFEHGTIIEKTVQENIFAIMKKICNLDINSKYINELWTDIIDNLIHFCEYIKIDIKKHIKAKMAYNKTRPHKHDKEY